MRRAGSRTPFSPPSFPPLASDKKSQKSSCICGNFPYIKSCELTSARFLESKAPEGSQAYQAPLGAAESESFKEEAIAIGNSYRHPPTPLAYSPSPKEKEICSPDALASGGCDLLYGLRRHLWH